MILVKTKQDVTNYGNGFVVFIIYFKIEKFTTYKEKKHGRCHVCKTKSNKRCISLVARTVEFWLLFRDN